jgi:glycosyltransferase involved in cell wall biosynthesis
VSSTPAISAIVPARDAEATIGATLGALAAQDLEVPFEVIVVDDGSRDRTIAIAEASAAPVEVIHQPGLGAAAARNAGAAAASADLLAFTDADCMPAPSWLREGLTAAAGADLVQGAVDPDPGATFEPYDHSVWVVAESGLYETANLFVTREVFDRVGGFEDWLGVETGRPMGEDVLFGWRARRSGARTVFCEAALVHHAVLPRDAGEFVAERRRLASFPALAKEIPELREALFAGRWFLSRRSAAFDAALAGTLAATVGRSRAPLLATIPYAWLVARRARRYGRRAPEVALVEVAADAVGLGALLAGSIRHRSLLL